MRGRRTIWAVAAALVIGTATLSVAASPTLGSPARVEDRAERLRPAVEGEPAEDAPAVVEMVERVNVERARRALPPLRLDDRASAAARSHAAEMASINGMQHAGVDGSDGGIRLTRAGYAWSAWAENIGAGFVDPASLLLAWMDSAGHRANLLGDYTEVGVGVVANAAGAPYWCLLVTRPA